MAIAPPSHYLPFYLLLLPATLLLLSQSPTSIAASDFAATASGIRVNLVHVDEHLNLTFSERLRRSIRRSDNRLRSLRRRLAGQATEQAAGSKFVVLPGMKDYLMSLSVGTPPVSFAAVIDTGSDLIWTQCAPCINCFGQGSSIFDPSSSSSFSKQPCSNQLCASLPAEHLSAAPGECNYTYQYADRYITKGFMASETLGLLGSENQATFFKNIVFGCGNNNQGFRMMGTGIVGLNRGKLSLISQLGSATGNQFSYTFIPYSDNPSIKSYITLGPDPSLTGLTPAMTTPLVVNPNNPEGYYVTLGGISVGGKRLPIPSSVFQFKSDGSGGVAIDSGSSAAYFEPVSYRQLRSAFVEAISQPPVANNTRFGLDLCFDSVPTTALIPELTLHFEGGELKLPSQSYFTYISDDLSCLLIKPGPWGLSLIGVSMQENYHVRYDLNKNFVSFTPVRF